MVITGVARPDPGARWYKNEPGDEAAAAPGEGTLACPIGETKPCWRLSRVSGYARPRHPMVQAKPLPDNGERCPPCAQWMDSRWRNSQIAGAHCSRGDGDACWARGAMTLRSPGRPAPVPRPRFVDVQPDPFGDHAHADQAKVQLSHQFHHGAPLAQSGCGVQDHLPPVQSPSLRPSEKEHPVRAACKNYVQVSAQKYRMTLWPKLNCITSLNPKPLPLLNLAALAQGLLCVVQRCRRFFFDEGAIPPRSRRACWCCLSKSRFSSMTFRSASMAGCRTASRGRSADRAGAGRCWRGRCCLRSGR